MTPAGTEGEDSQQRIRKVRQDRARFYFCRNPICPLGWRIALRCGAVRCFASVSLVALASHLHTAHERIGRELGATQTGQMRRGKSLGRQAIATYIAHPHHGRREARGNFVDSCRRRSQPSVGGWAGCRERYETEQIATGNSR